MFNNIPSNYSNLLKGRNINGGAGGVDIAKKGLGLLGKELGLFKQVGSLHGQIVKNPPLKTQHMKEIAAKPEDAVDKPHKGSSWVKRDANPRKNKKKAVTVAESEVKIGPHKTNEIVKKARKAGSIGAATAVLLGEGSGAASEAAPTAAAAHAGHAAAATLASGTAAPHVSHAAAASSHAAAATAHAHAAAAATPANRQRHAPGTEGFVSARSSARSEESSGNSDRIETPHPAPRALRSELQEHHEANERERGQLKAIHAKELEHQRGKHEEKLAELRDAHVRQLEQQEHRLREAIKAKEHEISESRGRNGEAHSRIGELTAKLTQLEARHEAALHELKAEHSRNMRASVGSALEGQKQQHREEMEQLRQQHRSQLAEQEVAHQAQKQGLGHDTKKAGLFGTFFGGGSPKASGGGGGTAAGSGSSAAKAAKVAPAPAAAAAAPPPPSQAPQASAAAAAAPKEPTIVELEAMAPKDIKEHYTRITGKTSKVGKTQMLEEIKAKKGASV
jgi:hypothetical protein